MANEQHVAMLLHDGVSTWNTWRKEKPEILPDFHRADLRDADLSGVDLHGADLSGANLNGTYLREAHLERAQFIGAHLIGAHLIGTYLSGANLSEANLSGADINGTDLSGADLSGAILFRADISATCLSGANLSEAYLSEASLSGADLFRANLSGAVLRGTDLNGADLNGADLNGADLSRANLSGAYLSGANLSDCTIYGIAAWDVHLDGSKQANLRITPDDEAAITVDNLEVAQFLYLLIHNQKIRDVLDTITSKVVLILGRFGERKANLDSLREELRNHPKGYIPVLFDFEPQVSRSILETVLTLANLARFVIVDLSEPNMARSEITDILKNVPSVPVQPVIEGEADLPPEYGTWKQFKGSFLPLYRYLNLEQLLANLSEMVIEPVERHVQARRIADGHSS